MNVMAQRFLEARHGQDGYFLEELPRLLGEAAKSNPGLKLLCLDGDNGSTFIYRIQPDGYVYLYRRGKDNYKEPSDLVAKMTYQDFIATTMTSDRLPDVALALSCEGL
jgi:hypothetical protein